MKRFSKISTFAILPLERVECAYPREWTGQAYQLPPTVTVARLKTELDQALATYTQWIAQHISKLKEAEEGAVIA